MKHIKLVVVGDKDSGKTTLLISYTTNAFPGEYIPTVFDNYSSNVMVEDQAINLQLWDTAGQEDYIKLRPLTYPQADVFLVLFSVVNPKSLENAQNLWIPEIRYHNPETPFVLVGTNTDLREVFYQHEAEYRSKGWEPIATERGEMIKEIVGAYDYVECSSLKQFHLKEVFETAIICVLRHCETPKEMKKRIMAEQRAEKKAKKLAKKEEKKNKKKKIHIKFLFSITIS